MQFRHTSFRNRLASLASLMVVLAPALSGLPATAAVTPPAKIRPGDRQTIANALGRLGFGARPGDIERVAAMGLTSYIEQQLTPESIPDEAATDRVAKLSTLNLAMPDLLARYNPPPPPPPKPAEDGKPLVTPAAATSTPPAPKPPNPRQPATELQRATVLRAVYGNRQLLETTVHFWENHFSIFIDKDADKFLMTAFDRDAVRPNALGRFRDLLGATAHSPAMLYYLDNWQSRAIRTIPAKDGQPARTESGLNENYARELLELHTMGVDGGYTQQDVREVARCFTGWTIRKPNEEGLFVFNPQMHDNGEKTVLGTKIPAGGGIADGERVLDLLAKHPATATFIATKLARRFVSDDPPAALVTRAARVFLKTDGSIRETLRTILLSPEFLSACNARGKVKTPFEFVVSALRATNADTDADPALMNWLVQMGQPIFGKLTPNGYPDRAEEWLTNGGMLNRMNFALALAGNRIKGTKVDPAALLGPADAQLGSRIIQTLLNGTVSDATHKALDSALSGTPSLQQAVAVAIAAPEFQRR